MEDRSHPQDLQHQPGRLAAQLAIFCWPPVPTAGYLAEIGMAAADYYLSPLQTRTRQTIDAGARRWQRHLTRGLGALVRIANHADEARPGA